MSKVLDEIDIDIKRLEQSHNSFNDKINEINNFIENLPRYVEEYSIQFEEETKLKKSDYPFIFICAAFQCLRQYLVTDFKERLDDTTAANKVKGNKKESSARLNKKFYQSVIQIKRNPVPFDAISGSKQVGAKVSGFNHRFKCPGHDPILGFFFGTLNIMTGTITVMEGCGNLFNLPGLGMRHYVVKTDIVNIKKNGVESLQFRDFIQEEVRAFDDIMEAVYQRIKNNPEEGLTALFEAIKKEYIHLKSDKDTEQSLPIPCVSLLSAKLSQEMSNAGLDLKNLETVGKQYLYSYVINKITHFIYYLIHQSSKGYTDEHKVRIEKILNVANVISTSSNLAYCLVGSMYNEYLLKKIDVGGCVITFKQLINSADFINAMEREYINRKLNNKIDEI